MKKSIDIPETIRRTRAAFDGAGERARIANELRLLARFDPDFSQRPRLSVLRIADKIAPEITSEKPLP